MNNIMTCYSLHAGLGLNQDPVYAQKRPFINPLFSFVLFCHCHLVIHPKLLIHIHVGYLLCIQSESGMTEFCIIIQ